MAQLNSYEKYWINLTDEEGIALARYNRGVKDGMAQGEQIKAMSVARNLKLMNLSVADIAKAEGLNFSNADMNGNKQLNVADIVKMINISDVEEIALPRYNRGVKDRMAQGEQIKAMSIARNLKLMNLSVADIAKATGLTEEEIEKV